jgi:hypothetical protein
MRVNMGRFRFGKIGMDEQIVSSPSSPAPGAKERAKISVIQIACNFVNSVNYMVQPCFISPFTAHISIASRFQ